MLELGKSGALFHRMIGELIASSGVEGLLTFGELSKHTLSAAMGAGMDQENLWHCATHDEIVDILKEVVRDGDLILVKGSRSMRMEKVVEKLTAGKG
jgi:UDP-N-acetylmuramoyl-tripeptide--D-alanyl-D-alanine ligase